MASFPALVAAEVERSRVLFPAERASLHESYAIILEEIDEFWDEVKLKASQRSPERLLVELVQVAAMAQRAAEDGGLLEITED